MNTEYKITTAETIEALSVLIRYIDEQVYDGTGDEAVLGRVRQVVDALENADRIIILP